MAANGKIDMALDDIISQNRPARRGAGARRGGGGGRGATRGRGAIRSGSSRGNGAPRFSQNFSPRTKNIPDGKWTHDRFSTDFAGGLRTASGAMNATTKLLISNLEFGVSDSDIKELFSEFGPVRRTGVHYDKSGRSLGSADVVYERRSDAVRAVKQYNGVPLDGRPMKVQIVGEGAVASPVKSTSFGNNRMRGMNRSNDRSPSSGKSGGRGRGSGRGGRGGKTEKKPMTQEQLDADLDSYINKMGKCIV